MTTIEDGHNQYPIIITITNNGSNNSNIINKIINNNNSNKGKRRLHAATANSESTKAYNFVA